MEQDLQMFPEIKIANEKERSNRLACAYSWAKNSTNIHGYPRSTFLGMHLPELGPPSQGQESSEQSARHHVSALCWPICCSGLKVSVQERCQLVARFHLCCLVGCCPSTGERSIQKGDVNGSLEGVVNLVLLIAPAPHALARRELFGKDLLEPVLQTHHRGLALEQLSFSLRLRSRTCRAGRAQVQLLTVNASGPCHDQTMQEDCIHTGGMLE